MKLAELLKEEQDVPMIVTLLRMQLNKGKPVFYVCPNRHGDLELHEVYHVGDEVEYFSQNATAEIAGKPYTSIDCKAPGYYSWKTDDIGQGRGNLGFGLAHNRADMYTMRKIESVDGRLDFIFGLKNFVNRWEDEHEGK